MTSASDNLELGLLGDFMFGRPEAIFSCIAEKGLKPEHFTNNEARRGYERILALKSTDPELIRSDLISFLDFPTVDAAVKYAAGERETDPLFFARRIEKIVYDARIRAMQSVVSQVNQFAAKQNASIEFLAGEMIRGLKPFTRTTSGSTVVKPVKLSDLGPVVPECENPLALFEDGWLRKGHAAFLVSTAGAGKSVITMQFCYAWALGREMFGIKPMKPLKIAVFQTEDDDDELRFFRDAMSYGYSHEYGWTDEEIEKAVENIDFFPVLGKMGDKFIDYFREIQSSYNYDLVIINPFQGVTDFDIADNTLVRQFTREKLDPIIKDAEKPCGLFIVHHTKKKTGDDNRRASGGKDVFSQYAGAGASEINNWMRAGLVILPFTKDGVFGYQLVASKRGGRLKRWERRSGYVLPTKFICHSSDEANYPFWSEMEPPENAKTASEKAEIAEKAKADALENDVRLLIARITQPMSASAVREQARLLFGKNRGNLIYKHLTDNLSDYGLMQGKGLTPSTKMLGTIGMLQSSPVG